MFYHYRFESDIYPALSRIPMHVRMKLDLTGAKISLKAWLAFALEERGALCHLPVETDEERNIFRAYLDSLMRRHMGAELARTAPIADPAWEEASRVPESVQAKSQKKGPAVAPAEWGRWNRYQRYALYKLSVSKSDPEWFYETLREFRNGSVRKA